MAATHGICYGCGQLTRVSGWYFKFCGYCAEQDRKKQLADTHPTASRILWHIGGHQFGRSRCLGEPGAMTLLQVAEQWGDTADYAWAEDSTGRTVELVRRNPDGDGLTWYQATV